MVGLTAQFVMAPRPAAARECQGESKQFLQLLPGHLDVAQNPRKKPGSDCFTSVDRNDCRASVRMPHEMVIALDSQELESVSTQRCDEFLSSERRKLVMH